MGENPIFDSGFYGMLYPERLSIFMSFFILVYSFFKIVEPPVILTSIIGQFYKKPHLGEHHQYLHTVTNNHEFLISSQVG